MNLLKACVVIVAGIGLAAVAFLSIRRKTLPFRAEM